MCSIDTYLWYWKLRHLQAKTSLCHHGTSIDQYPWSDHRFHWQTPTGTHGHTIAPIDITPTGIHDHTFDALFDYSDDDTIMTTNTSTPRVHHQQAFDPTNTHDHTIKLIAPPVLHTLCKQMSDMLKTLAQNQNKFLQVQQQENWERIVSSCNN